MLYSKKQKQRVKRVLEDREPKLKENPKHVLLVRGMQVPKTLHDVLAEFVIFISSLVPLLLLTRSSIT